MKKILILLISVLLSTYSFSQNNIITLKYSYYTVYFDTVMKSPIQADYQFTKKNLEEDWKRSAFKMDKKLDRRFQTNPSPNSKIYDRGHLAPNDNFRFDSIAQLQSMLYTNQAPQYYSLNRGVWKGIEMYVNLKGKYIDPKDYMIIKTGIILKGSYVPLYFWKCIYYKNNTECFLCPNNPAELKSNVITDYKIKIQDLQSKFNFLIK